MPLLIQHSGENCVEVTGARTLIAVRDSKNPDAVKLALPSASFRDLVTAIKHGAHDLP